MVEGAGLPGDDLPKALLILCSGRGGPWPWLRPVLAERGVCVSVCLTDKYPNLIALQPSECPTHPSIRYQPQPLDAMRVDRFLDTLFVLPSFPSGAGSSHSIGCSSDARVNRGARRKQLPVGGSPPEKQGGTDSDYLFDWSADQICPVACCSTNLGSDEQAMNAHP